MKIHDYMLNEFLVPRLDRLNVSDYNRLLDVFKQVRNVTFPSIIQQLRTKFWARRLIDSAFLKILGYTDTEIDRILDYLYPALANEILILKQLMTEGKEEID